MKAYVTATIAASLMFILAGIPARAGDPAVAMASVVSLLPEWPPDINRNEEPEASGVVIFDGHYVLTAQHVVDSALSILLRTYDGKVMSAKIVGGDAASDLALLKIDNPLPAIQFSGDATLGQEVCAIGNAFGLGLSMACGVVSGIHRAGVGFNGIEDFVQTDTAVNPGASGGALVDRQGRLVGILSAIFTKQSDANIGVNFAVATPLAERVAIALRDNGRVRWLVSGLRLKEGLSPGETGQLGARIVRVREGSPAFAAGFMVDDLIVGADDRIIRKPKDFVSAMARITAPGTLSVRIVRQNATHELVLIFEDQK